MTILSNAVSRDVEAQLIGMRFTCMAGPALRITGWYGGIWVHFVDLPDEGDFVVEISNGNQAVGYVLAESERYGRYYEEGSPENYTSYQRKLTNQGPNTVDVITGGGTALFRYFETVALSGGSRSGGPITYHLNETLYISENGLLCNDSAAQLAMVGIATPIPVGLTSHLPQERDQWRLGALINYP